MEGSDLDLIYVGNEKDVVMFEGAANEISEADFNAALKAAQRASLSLRRRRRWLKRQAKRSVSLSLFCRRKSLSMRR